MAIAVAVLVGVASQPYMQVASTPESIVQETVRQTISMYDADNHGTLERISAMALTDPHYPFVLNPDSLAVVAHGANPHLVGTPSVLLANADRPTEVIIADLELYGYTWAEYVFKNPQSGAEESKHSYLVLHDGYIFGSGYYMTTPAP